MSLAGAARSSTARADEVPARYMTGLLSGLTQHTQDAHGGQDSGGKHFYEPCGGCASPASFVTLACSHPDANAPFPIDLPFFDPYGFRPY